MFKFCFKRDRVPALKREARLLKRLRKYAHPSLVEVYDVTEGDRPPHFLEMEYVEGPSLAEWLADGPPRTERLEVLAQIADALDTVHAAGIYHRDIKPSNILLTRREDGKLLAKLADFGLGAAEDTELLRSIQASRVEGVAGTWDYLAPELRDGNPATVQTDIYSLGVTLYQIVTGGLERPLTADWEVHLDSEVLCDDVRRCVARDPGDRWPRAGELATALRGHDQRLEQRALEREREEHRRRAQRLRRVAAVVALFAVVSAGFGGFAMTQWFEARAQRDRAVQQKRLALEAVNRLTHDVPNRLKDVPGAMSVLRETMEQNVEILDRILALEPDTPFARREKGVNYINIGDRWLLLGETEKAAKAFDSALAIAQELADANPNERHYQEDLYIAYERAGKIRLALGKTEDALISYESARGMAQELVDRYADTDARLTLSYALNHVGEAYEALGRKTDAEKVYRTSLEVMQALRAENPHSGESTPRSSFGITDPVRAEVSRALSISYEKVGDISLDLGRPDEALEAYEAGMKLAMKLRTRPGSVEAHRDLAAGFDDLGMAYLRLGEMEDALSAFESGFELSLSLADAAPDNVLAQRGLSVSYDRLGDVYQQLGRPEDALFAFEAGLAIVRKRLDADPANAEAQHDIVAGYQKLGNGYLALERVEEALETYRTARAHAERAADADPGNAEARRNLSVCCNKVGDALAGSGQFADALTAYQDGLTSAQAVADLDPGSTEAQRDLGISHFKLMIVHRLFEDVPSWREAGALCAEQFERVFDLAPDDPRSKQDLMGVLSEYSLGLLVNTEAGGPDMQKGLELAQRLNALSENTNPNHLDILALAHLMTGDAAKAASTQQKALDLLPADATDPALTALRERFQNQLEGYEAAAAPTRGEP